METKVEKNNFAIIAIVVGIVLVIAGGVIYFLRGRETSPAEDGNLVITPTETEFQTSPVPTAEATPTPELEKEDLSIQVLNGSGVPGAAGDAQEFLEKMGYTVSDTGNADSYDYEQTEVSIKEEMEEYLELLLEDLGQEYEVSTKTGTLEEDSEYDAVVIVGEE